MPKVYFHGSEENSTQREGKHPFPGPFFWFTNALTEEDLADFHRVEAEWDAWQERLSALEFEREVNPDFKHQGPGGLYSKKS